VGTSESCCRVLLRLKRFEQLEDVCRTALGRHPENDLPAQRAGRRWRSWSTWKPPRPSRGALWLSIRGRPRSSIRNLHWHVVALGRYAEGERVLREAAARDPHSTEVLAALGDALVGQDRLEPGDASVDLGAG